MKADAPYNDLKGFTEAARKASGTFNSGLVQGITEFTFWGYTHVEKLQITQVPYRDINVAPVDLGEGRIQVVMSSYAIVQPQTQAGRIKIIAMNNKTRAPVAPEIPTAREQGFPSLEVEGLVGLFGLKNMPPALKDKIAADFKAAAEDGSDRRPAQANRSGDQRRRPEGIRRCDRRTAGQRRRGREGDRLQAEAVVLFLASLFPGGSRRDQCSSNRSLQQRLQRSRLP